MKENISQLAVDEFSYSPRNGFFKQSSDYPLTLEQINNFQQDGHLLLRAVVSPTEIATYRPAIVGTVNRYDREQQAMEKTVSGQSQGWKFVENLCQLDPVAQRLILARRFGKIAADLLGVNTVRLFRDQSYFKAPGGGNTPWHQDGYFMPLDTTQVITMWIALSDVSPQMAPMTFVTGSHRQGYMGTSMPLDESMDEFEQSTIKSAVTFLLAARDSKGWWIDFHLAAGLSDEWVTGYVGTMLATIPDNRIPEAVSTAWNLLDSRRYRTDGKWGYNRFPPGDADSTGWALQLAYAIGKGNSERAMRVMQSLAAHKRPDGGICTYESEESIRAFIHASPKVALEGWCGSHTCVSAAIAALPEYNFQLQDYLRSTQLLDGSWQAYWWHDPEYATALAAEAIAAKNPDSDCITKAVLWAMRRLESQGFVATNDSPIDLKLSH